MEVKILDLNLFKDFCLKENSVLNKEQEYYERLLNCVIESAKKEYKVPPSVVEVYYLTQLFFNEGVKSYFDINFLEYIFASKIDPFDKLSNYLGEYIDGFIDLTHKNFKTRGIFDLDVFSVSVRQKGKEVHKVIEIRGKGLKLLEYFLPYTMGMRKYIITRVKSKTGVPYYTRYKIENNIRGEITKKVVFFFLYKVDRINKIWLDGLPKEAPRNKKYGIVGWNTNYTPSSWLTKILGHELKKQNPKDFPKKIKNVKGGFHYKFGLWGEYCSTTTARLRYLRSVTFLFDKLYPKAIYSHEKYDWPATISEFEKGTYNSVVVTWHTHVRYGYISAKDKKFNIYDPWKKGASGKNWKIIVNAFKFRGWKVNFCKKKYDDQENEGSCAYVSFMRALMVCLFGEEGAYMEPQDDFAVLSWLLGRVIKE